MPHKAAAKKKPVRKTKTASAPAAPEEQNEEQFEINPKKISKPIEIDEPEVLIGQDDKGLGDDEMGDENKDDDAAEDAIGLDDEEINPFGDKWEE